MEIIQKTPCLPEDFSRMFVLANQCDQDAFHIADLPYRFSSWAFDSPENACLWTDTNGKLLAWAVMQSPFWTIDLVLNPEFFRVLFPRILSWVDQRAFQIRDSIYGHSAWFMTTFSEQSKTIRSLEKSGFICQSFLAENAWSKVWMERSPTKVLRKYPLPDGYRIRPFGGDPEVPDYVTLHQETFETKNMTLAWRARTIRQTAYHPEFDLLVEAPDGRICAFCIAWINASNPDDLVAQIEPLGCHPEFRNLALGRVLLAEMLNRLFESGVQRIGVETDGYRETAFRLYQSLGFEVKREILVFRKDYF